MIRRGGQRVVGFGDILEKMERTDPLYECHHDAYTRLQTFGTIVATVAVTAGIIFIVSAHRG